MNSDIHYEKRPEDYVNMIQVDLNWSGELMGSGWQTKVHFQRKELNQSERVPEVR